MFYQLSTGKTVDITFDQWLNMDALKEQELIAANAGIDIDDPFVTWRSKNEKAPYEDAVEELPDIEEIIEPLPIEIVEEIVKEIKKD